MLLGVADPGSGRVLSPESDGGRDKEEVRDSLARCETRSLETPEPGVAAETQTLSLRLSQEYPVPVSAHGKVNCHHRHKPQRKLSIVVRNRKTSLPSLRSYSMPSERVSLINRNPSILLTRASLEMMDLVNRGLFRQHILDLFSSLIQEGE